MNWHKQKFDTHQTITGLCIEIRKKNINNARTYDWLILCAPIGFFEHVSSPTSTMIVITLGGPRWAQNQITPYTWYILYAKQQLKCIWHWRVWLNHFLDGPRDVFGRDKNDSSKSWKTWIVKPGVDPILNLFLTRIHDWVHFIELVSDLYLGKLDLSEFNFFYFYILIFVSFFINSHILIFTTFG